MSYIDFSNIHGHRQVLNLSSRGPITIGRDPACDICFPDRSISRVHSRLYVENDKWYVEDMNSTNGTLVNQKAIDRSPLTEGDVIQLGPFALMYRTVADKEPSVVLDKDEMTRAISKSQIYEYSKVADSHQRWVILLQIAEALDALGTTQELLTHLMAALKKIFSPLTCIIAFGDEYLREPVRQGKKGDSEGLEASIARVMARVREKRQGVIFDADTTPQQANADNVGPQMCAPILAAGKLRGIIYLNRTPHSGSFSRDDLKTLLIFCRLIVTAASSSEKLARLDAENRIMSASYGKVGAIVGQSEKTLALVDLIENKVGRVDTTVLFTGETGTGKTWAAKALHLASKRAKGPFIKVNCAAIPENLIESELFGHEKGAFSGATSRKIGMFEAANGGTLLLDEIGEINPSSQAKLLTVLQDKQIVRLGSTKPIDVDIRLVAATNIDLKRAVENGAFRSDLFYRLNIVTLDIPPLRERSEDIIPLAQHFLGRFSDEAGKHISGLDASVAKALEQYTWPGNIRELSNAVERAVIFAEHDAPLTSEDFPEEIMAFQRRETEALSTESLSSDKQSEKERVVTALSQAGGNRREAARILGWYPQKLYARLREFNLK